MRGPHNLPHKLRNQRDNEEFKNNSETLTTPHTQDTRRNQAEHTKNHNTTQELEAEHHGPHYKPEVNQGVRQG